MYIFMQKCLALPRFEIEAKVAVKMGYFRNCWNDVARLTAETKNLRLKKNYFNKQKIKKKFG